jgi:hypothetical protein
MLDSDKDKDLLLKVVQVLAVIAEDCGPATKHYLHPYIGVAEFLEQAIKEEKAWFLRSRVVARRWHTLLDFFGLLAKADERVEFYIADARQVVREHQLLPLCEEIHSRIAARGHPSRPLPTP